MRLAVLLATLLAVAPAWADRARELSEAEQLLSDGANEQAETAAAALLADPKLARAERAQAQRIRGLALFYLGRRDDAEAAMWAYLQLEPDAHLDPALVPPETVVFFESVRTRHAGDILVVKPRPKRKRQIILNFIPPGGQLQNGHRAKGFIIAGVGVGLIAANITTYAMLTSSCHNDLTCDRDASSARQLRVVNLVTGAAAIALYGYAVIDGLIYYQRQGREPPRVVGERPWAVAPMIGWGRQPLGVQAAFSF